MTKEFGEKQERSRVCKWAQNSEFSIKMSVSWENKCFKINYFGGHNGIPGTIIHSLISNDFVFVVLFCFCGRGGGGGRSSGQIPATKQIHLQQRPGEPSNDIMS